MSTSKSVIYNTLDRIRAYLDDPDVDAKYDNTYILRHIMNPSMVDVIARLNHTRREATTLRYAITLDPDIKYYKLPPQIHQVWRFVLVDSDGDVTFDAIPQDRMHWRGPGWTLEGGPGSLVLYVEDPPQAADTAEVWYTTNGDTKPHYVAATKTVAERTGDNTFKLDPAPSLGDFDDRENAYGGMILRIFGDGSSDFPVTEELVIESVAEAAQVWTATVRPDFAETALSQTGMAYEIVPMGVQAFTEAVALRAALKLGTQRRMSQTSRDQLKEEYRMALKTIGDNVTGIQGRLPAHIAKDTIDNELQRPGWGFGRRRI